MSKKILSVIVAIMMVVSMFAVCANAVSYEDDETVAEYTQDWALSEPVDNGDGTYTVEVLLTTNYATGPIQFVLTNSDTSVAAIQSVTLGDAIPESYNATVSVSKAKGKVMIIADTASVNTITGEEINGVIATVVYTYAGSGSAEIAIDDNAKSATNVAGTLIAARMSDGDLVTGEAITGQTVTVGDSVIIGGGATPPTLAVKEGTIGVIDTTRTLLNEITGEECTGYIYGINPYDLGETVDSAFEVVGDGEMEIIPSSLDCEYGTGAMVNVLDVDGNVVESYVLIIFGDVNGDGEIGYSDAADIELNDGGMYGLDPETGDDIYGFEGLLPAYAAFAGDLNGDDIAGYSDAADVELHDGGMYGLDPETGDDLYGCEGRITPEYIIAAKP